MPDFTIVSDLRPTGDQPDAIEQLVEGLVDGKRFQTLLGVTGSGKTFTMANVIEQVNRPTIVLAHNKTLAAQLYAEFKEFFPNNAVEYFVSYYDYYQPEAYVPRTDTFIEKDADINEEIDKLRHAATRALLTRRDVIIVASVSCIYGFGSPEEYSQTLVSLRRGGQARRDKIVRHLIDIQYDRNDMTLVRGTFRVRGDTLEIFPAYEDIALRVEFFGDEVERIVEVDPLTGELLVERLEVDVYPAKHFVTTEDKLRAAIRDIEQELEERLPGARGRGQVARGSETSPAHDVRPRDAAGDRLLRRRRELFDALVPPQARGAAVDAAGLFPGRLPALRRRVAHLDPAGARHVRGRSLAKGCAGRARVPPALRSRQPSAHLFRVRTHDSPGRVRLGHARSIRTRAQ